MPFATITQSCGHDTRILLARNADDNDRRREYLRNHPCRDCQPKRSEELFRIIKDEISTCRICGKPSVNRYRNICSFCSEIDLMTAPVNF